MLGCKLRTARPLSPACCTPLPAPSWSQGPHALVSCRRVGGLPPGAAPVHHTSTLLSPPLPSPPSHQLSIAVYTVHSEHSPDALKHGVLAVAPLGEEVHVPKVQQALDGGRCGVVAGGQPLCTVPQVSRVEGDGGGVVGVRQCQLGIVEQVGGGCTGTSHRDCGRGSPWRQ